MANVALSINSHGCLEVRGRSYAVAKVLIVDVGDGGRGEVGAFGARLIAARCSLPLRCAAGKLVVGHAATAGSDTSLIAIDCRGRAKVLAQTPSTHVEGGMAVAPRSFGRFGGRFVAADEDGGDLVVFDRRGRAHTLVASGLPKGGDIGVESVGFIPERGPANALALLADRGGQAEPHPGDDAFLGVTVGDLLRAGARRGDLLAATEGGAQTIAVRCPRTCHVRHVADGPATAHAEGHIVFVSPPAPRTR